MAAAELKRIGDGFVRVGFEAGPLSQWMFFGGDHFLFMDRASRTPGPPPFSGMNSIPAVSKAARIA